MTEHPSQYDETPLNKDTNGNLALDSVTDDVSRIDFLRRIDLDANFRAEFYLELSGQIFAGFSTIQEQFQKIEQQMGNVDALRPLYRLVDNYLQFAENAYALISETYAKDQTQETVMEEMLSQKEELEYVLTKHFDIDQSQFKNKVQAELQQRAGFQQYFHDELHRGATADAVHIFLNDVMGVQKFLDTLIVNLTKNRPTTDFVANITKSMNSAQERVQEIFERLKNGYKWEEIGIAPVFSNVEYWLGRAGKRYYPDFKLKASYSTIDLNSSPIFEGSMGLIKMWVDGVTSNAVKSFEKARADYLSQFPAEAREAVQFPPELANLELSLGIYYVGYGEDRRLELAIMDNGAGVTNPAATRETQAVTLTHNETVVSTYGSGNQKGANKSGTGTGMRNLQRGLTKLSNGTSRIEVRSIPGQPTGAISTISFAAPEAA